MYMDVQARTCERGLTGEQLRAVFANEVVDAPIHGTRFRFGKTGENEALCSCAEIVKVEGRAAGILKLLK